MPEVRAFCVYILPLPTKCCCHACHSRGWMQEVVGEGNEVLQMSEGVFVEHLADYPEMELSWLQQLYEGSAHGGRTAPA